MSQYGIAGIILAALVLFYMHKKNDWKMRLDTAQSATELRVLRQDIEKKLPSLQGEQRDTAQLFIEVIDRKLVRRPDTSVL